MVPFYPDLGELNDFDGKIVKNTYERFPLQMWI
jgi:hypothetical protein